MKRERTETAKQYADTRSALRKGGMTLGGEPPQPLGSAAHLYCLGRYFTGSDGQAWMIVDVDQAAGVIVAGRVADDGSVTEKTIPMPERRNTAL